MERKVYEYEGYIVETEEDVKKPGLEGYEVGAVCWSIDQVFSLNEVWRRDKSTT